EVCICFGDRLLRGNRARKVSALAWQGFDSPNYPRLGTIGESIRINQSAVRPAPDNERYPFRVDRALTTDIMDISLFPGLNPERLAAVLNLSDIKGVILRTYGAGNAPSHEGFLQVIAEAIKGGPGPGRIILNVTQCLEGSVQQGHYAASEGLMTRGVVSGLDMTPEAALAKMMWLMAKWPVDRVRTELQISQRGEQSENLVEISLQPRPTGDVDKYFRLYTGQAPAWMDMKRLKRAFLRVTPGAMTGISEGDEIGVQVFGLVQPEKTDQPELDRSMRLGLFAGEFRDSVDVSRATVIAGDVTSVVRRFSGQGQIITLGLKWLKTAPEGATSVTLTLLTQV
ncbi:MAG: asparaginase, partial [Deltaproteobacteria bacterium]|nr:asparaginase [Deltaproteobacteria bacterium]